MKNLLAGLSNLVAGRRSKWITLLVWILITGVLSIVWPPVNEMEKNNAANLPADAPSVQADLMAKEQFPGDEGIPALLVWNREGGLTDADYGHLQELTAYFTEHPVEGQQIVIPLQQVPLPALKQEASEDGSAFILPFIFKKDTDPEILESGMEEIHERAEGIFGHDPFATGLSDPNRVSARVSGPVGISIDAVNLFSSADVSLLIATVLLVLILLLLIYRSPVLAIIPLIAVGFAYGVTGPILGKIAEQGWITVDAQAISIMTVLLFGAGTDYCLFMISHFRSTLTKERNIFSALTQSVKGATGAIAMSGFTVVVALLVLLLAQYGAIHRFAIPFSLSIFVMMTASLTLVPALLAILGRGSFFPFVPRTPEMIEERNRKKGKAVPGAKASRQHQAFGGWIGRIVTRQPWLIVISTIVVLGALAVNVTRIEYSSDLLSSFPEDSPARQGFTVIGEKFTPGELAPVSVIVDTKGEQVRLKEALSELPYADKVSEPVMGENNQYLSVQLEFNMNPYSHEAISYIPELRSTAVQALEEAGIGNPEEHVWIKGQTATQYDTEMTYQRDTRAVIPVVIILISLLLLVYLRSIVAMVYLILTVVLSYFSALGLGWIVIHDLMGANAIQGLIPLYAFVFLVALGEDYNIFLISSIWKKRITMPLKQAIREGVQETGGVITSAGLILAGTFAVLATLPVQVLVQFGIISAIGVLLDTFIVRPFLVPAITTILGKWAFWPGKGGIEPEGQAQP